MSLRRTSKDLKLFFLPSYLSFRQNLDKNQNLEKQVNSNVNKEFLPKILEAENPFGLVLQNSAIVVKKELYNTN